MLLANKTVLVVEDDFLIAGLLQDMLSDLGCDKITIAYTVESAIEALHGVPPDLVILDLNLGGKSGLPVAEILREKNIRFLFSSGYGADGLPPQWRTAVVVSKPFAPGEFEQNISQVMAR